MMFQNIKLAIFLFIGFVIPQMVMGKLGATEIEVQAEKPAPLRSMVSSLQCNADGTLALKWSDCVAILSAGGTTCTVNQAVTADCKVTVTDLPANGILIFNGLTGTGSRVIANSSTNSPTATLKIPTGAAGIQAGGCIVLKSDGAPKLVDGSDAAIATGKTTAGGLVTTDESACSFALGRFGGIGLGLFVTFVSSFLMF